jgi:hypothetical protein
MSDFLSALENFREKAGQILKREAVRLMAEALTRSGDDIRIWWLN